MEKQTLPSAVGVTAEGRRNWPEKLKGREIFMDFFFLQAPRAKYSCAARGAIYYTIAYAQCEPAMQTFRVQATVMCNLQVARISVLNEVRTTRLHNYQLFYMTI